MTTAARTPQPEPVRARRALAQAIIAFRWLVFTWFLIGNIVSTRADRFERPLLAWITVAIAGAWTIVLTVIPAPERRRVRAADLVVTIVVILMSGVVVPDRTLIGGRLFFAATYPLGTALAWGEFGGPLGGVIGALMLGVATLFARPLNGIPIGGIEVSQVTAVITNSFYYLLAGLAGGVTAVLLDRWEEEQRILTEQSMRASERAARLAERESLGRQIHDSVLQALAMVHKRGRELATRGGASAAEVAEIADMARKQEAELRALILREPEDPPTDTVSLRAALEKASRDVEGVPVTVSAVGPIWMRADQVGQLTAAVVQALQNTVEHARATRAAVFAELDGDTVSVTVRDDGVGFVYDEEALRARSKAGLLMSMKGRVEALGGSMAVESAPGRGTEIEFRVPLADE